MRRLTGITLLAALALCWTSPWTSWGRCDEPGKTGEKKDKEKDKTKDKDKVKEKDKRPAPATLEVRVHPAAELYFDAAPTMQRGPVRMFVTPPLVPGYVYSYEVVARWQDRDGKSHKESKKVMVQPGQRTKVEFAGSQKEGGGKDKETGEKGKEKRTPREIVERAIKAAGGENNLKKHQAATWKQKGTYYGMGDGLPYTGSMAVQWPDKFRMEVEDVFTMVLNGNKGWMKAGGETKELSKEELKHARDTNRAEWATTLLPLKDKAYSLSAIEGAKVNDKSTFGVKVTRKGHPDVKLYFDKKSGLLVKSEFTVHSGEENKDMKQEVYYHGYHDVGGAQVPNRVVINRDGRVYVEADMSGYKAGKVDPKLFDMP